MRIRKRNRFLRRVVLGFAVMALVVPATAVARVDSGIGDQQSTAKADVTPLVRDWPGYNPAAFAGSGTPVGMPHAGLNDYLKSRDSIEMVRLEPRSTLRNSDLIEKVRLSPRDVSTPQVVSSPGFDWGDAGIGAAVIVGIALLGAAAFFGTRHLGRPQTA
jgi:hypothetical protein